MKKILALKTYLLFLVLYCWLSPTYPEPETEQLVKRGFIYNYAKFVSWPNVSNTDTSPFNFCILGSQPLVDKLLQLHNKKVNSRTIQISLLNQEQATQNCHILFISESEAARLDKKLPPLATLPVLTISTIPDFIHSGGMIGLKILDNKVRFDINLGAAQKAGLSINSQLLTLADEVLK